MIWRPGVRCRSDVRGLGLAFALCLTPATTLAAQAVDGALDGVRPAPSLMDEAREAEIDAMTAAIGSTLRCPVCRQQSVAESSSRIALDMQGVIRTKLIAGETPEQIEAYFLDAYGPWILLKPKAEGVNLLVYAAPAVMFLLGGLWIAVRLRRDRAAADASVVSDHETPPTTGGRDRHSTSDRAWLDAAVRGS